MPQGTDPEAVVFRAKWENADEKLREAIYSSMQSYLRMLPPFLQAPFNHPLYEAVNLPQLIYGFIEPFRQLKFTVPVLEEFQLNLKMVYMLLESAGKLKNSDLVYPQHHPGTHAEIASDYLRGTPFRDLVTIPVPFAPFTDKVRFAHQWVMADSGMGKTVLLSAQIQADLDRVARGEASVFILDPKHRELTRFLPRLKRFAPGGDLHDRLIYLEPSKEHPLALNMFDFHQSDYSEVDAMTRSFLSTFETSGNMDNIISFALQALEHIPDATVYTFKDLLFYKRDRTGVECGFDILSRKADLAPHLAKVPKPVRDFLREGMFGATYALSLAAVQARLDSFIKDPFLRGMFTHPRSRINLPELLGAARVVIVNADQSKLQEATAEVFGRFFVSRLLQTSLKRRARKANDIPTFCYIDEAQAFIADDPSVAPFLAQARDTNMSLCISNHHTGEVQNIEKALNSAAVKCAPLNDKGLWKFTIRGRPYEVPVPHVDFSKDDNAMSDEEWAAIIAKMREDYCVPPKDPPRPRVPPAIPEV